jgi:hypothetical protein
METKQCIACTNILPKGKKSILCPFCIEKGYRREIEKLRVELKQAKGRYEYWFKEATKARGKLIRLMDKGRL